MILANRHHIWLFAAAYTAGILLAGQMPQHQILPAILILAGIGAVCYLHPAKKECVILALLLSGAVLSGFGLTRHQAMQYTKRVSLAEQHMETSVRISGILTQKEQKSDKYLYQIKQTYLETDQTPVFLGNILLYTTKDNCSIGTILTAEGELDVFLPARNEGNFDFAAYYQQMNITCRFYADTVTVQKPSRFSIREVLYQLQQKIMQTYTTELNERDAGILSTLVAGSNAQLDAQTKESYRKAGISHILAVSGLHISVFGFSVYRFLRRCRRSYPCAALLSSLCVIDFAMMSGFGVSAQRAVIMYLCIMGAEILGRKYDASHGLALAACIILLRNPFAIYQSGFLFSFTALLAITVYSGLRSEREKAIQTASEKRKNHIKGRVGTWFQDFWKRLRLNLFLQLWLMPLTAWFYYEIPVYALFLNLLVIPLCGWLLGFGVLGAVVGMKLPVCSKWILILCHWILNIYETGIDLTDRLPGHLWITGQPSMKLLILYYGIFGGYVIVYHFGKKWNLYSKIRSVFAGICVACFALCLLVPPKDLSGIYFLDVGQGDGIMISDGKQKHIFIDGGSTSESAVGTYRVLPFLKYHRIRQIDAWIVTHTDADHISGLTEALESGYPIRRLLLAKAAPADDALEHLVTLAKENGTEVVFVQANTTLTMQDATMTCLYPEAEEAETEKNALSQVWRYESDGFSVLLTGDLGGEQEQILVERNLLQPVTVLKTAHHGSAYSSSETFLEAIRPAVAVISCGEKNRYGHPASETIERLEQADTSIAYTMKSGQISVVKEHGKWKEVYFIKDKR